MAEERTTAAWAIIGSQTHTNVLLQEKSLLKTDEKSFCLKFDLSRMDITIQFDTAGENLFSIYSLQLRRIDF
jgi:hypothetical protein